MAVRNRRTSRPRRRRKLQLPDPPRHTPSAPGRRAGYVFLGVVALVLVNLYVFVWSRKSLRNVYRSATVKAAVPSRSGADGGVGAPGQARKPDKPDRSLLNLRLPGSITRAVLQQEEEDALLEVEAFTVHGYIRRGDNLYSALKRVGVNRLLGDIIVRTLDHLYDFRKARPGQKFSVRLSQDRRRLLAFAYQAGPGESYSIRRRGKKLVAKRVHKPVVTRTFELAAPVKGSLWETFRDLHEDGRLMAAFIAVFSWDLNLYTDVKKGDAIRLIVEKRFQGESFLRYGRLLAAEYRGQRRRLRAFWYRAPKGGGGYYDEQGRSLHRLLLRSPLKYKRISSPFDRKRMHPVLHMVRPHLGVDYAAPTGTPIWAVADGEVIYIGRNRAAGKMIVLQHEQNIRTVYMHMHRFARGLKKGSKVRQRQVIGFVGATGRVTGPHLHFGLKINGVYRDPEKAERRRLSPVPARLRADFRRSITPLSGALNALRIAQRPYKRLAGRAVTRVANHYRNH